ncbi:MAG: nitroreductase family protein [Bacteroidales bacterium]|nr:nitroreductase family protein [Bacteroidales bacterium]
MDFIKFVSERYSVRNYDPLRKVEKEKLLRIIEAGRMAPSAANRQPWKVLVVQSPENLKRLQTAYPANWFANASTILVVKGMPDEAWTRKADGYNAIETDLTIMMDHLILAAHAEDLSTCWIAAFDKQKLQDALQLADNEVVFAITPLGYPVEGETATHPKTRKSLDEIVEWI